MISLSTSAFYERATRQVGTLRAQAEELQQQIGTGNRLSRSSDDPVAAARMRSLQRDERLAAIDQRNSDLASTDLKLTDAAVGAVADVIIRAQELATRAANDTLSDTQRASIGTEIENLRLNLMTVMNARNHAGYSLFGGQASGAAYAISGSAVTYVGNGIADPVDLGEGQSVNAVMTGPELIDFTVDGAPTDLFAVLGNLATALQSSTGQAAASQQALAGLSAGLEKVTTAQTVIGARMGWVEILDERRVARGELVADEQRVIGGADIAETMTRLTEVMTVLEASQASFVRLASLSLFDMMR
jgi:flagellar hook-associated protein 3 FlgL